MSIYSDGKSNYRELTVFEKHLIQNILDGANSCDKKIADEIPKLLGAPDPETGSLWLSSPDENGNIVQRNTKGGAFAREAIYRSSSDRPISFILFKDDLDRLSELLIVRYDLEDFPIEYELDRIVYDTEAR